MKRGGRTFVSHNAGHGREPFTIATYKKRETDAELRRWVVKHLKMLEVGQTQWLGNVSFTRVS